MRLRRLTKSTMENCLICYYPTKFNETINRKKKSQLTSEFIIGTQKVIDPNQIANAFNDYFINIGNSLSQQIQPAHNYSDYLRTQINSSFSFTLIEESTVIQIINKLKNKSSYGHDHISNNIIKRAKEVLVKPLTLLTNTYHWSISE